MKQESESKNVLDFMTPKSLFKKKGKETLNQSKMSKPANSELHTSYDQSTHPEKKSKFQQEIEQHRFLSHQQESKYQRKQRLIDLSQFLEQKQPKQQISNKLKMTLSISEQTQKKSMEGNLSKLTHINEVANASHRKLYLDSCRSQAVEYVTKMKLNLQDCSYQINYLKEIIQEAIQQELEAKINQIRQKLYLFVNSFLQKCKNQAKQIYIQQKIQYMAEILQLEDCVSLRTQQMSDFLVTLNSSQQVIWKKITNELLQFDYQQSIKQIKAYIEDKDLNVRVKQITERAKICEIGQKGRNPMRVEELIRQFKGSITN